MSQQTHVCMNTAIIRLNECESKSVHGMVRVMGGCEEQSYSLFAPRITNVPRGNRNRRD